MSLFIEKLNQQADFAETRLSQLQEKLRVLESKLCNNENDDAKHSNDKIKVYYWRLKNRGNYIRLLLSESGMEFEDIMDNDIIKSKCKCSNNNNGSQLRFEVMAPPFIEHNNVILSQCVSIQQYIAQITNLCPKSLLDNTLSNMILENCNDMLEEMIEHKNDNLEKLTDFLNNRFQNWMNIFEKPLMQKYDTMSNKDFKTENESGNGNENFIGYYFENRVTVADIAVCNMMDGYHELFGDRYNDIITVKHPILEQHYQHMSKRQRIKKILDEQNKQGIAWFPSKPFENMRQIIKDVKI